MDAPLPHSAPSRPGPAPAETGSARRLGRWMLALPLAATLVAAGPQRAPETESSHAGPSAEASFERTRLTQELVRAERTVTLMGRWIEARQRLERVQP